MLTTNTFAEYGLKILKWILNNLNWMAPLVITVLFSALNLKLAKNNIKSVEIQGELQREMAEKQEKQQHEMEVIQYKLQNNSFCYQLFDRRMKIYTSIKEMLAKVIQEAEAPADLISRYLRETRETPMLFGPEVTQKVDDIYQILIKYHAVSTVLNHNLETGKCSENHEELCDQDAELLKAITDENTALMQTFECYISFKDYKIEPTEKVKK